MFTEKFSKTGSIVTLAIVLLFLANQVWAADMVWVYIDDQGVPGHEGFTGYMSKYETTNAQYYQFLNEALASGEITVWYTPPFGGNIVYSSNDSSHSEPYINVDRPPIIYSGGSFSAPSRDGYDMSNHPVTTVSWYGAKAFCDYYGYSLPTEWEWQAVADYDGSYRYGCGTSIDSSRANYDWNNPLGLSSHPYTTPVGYYPAYGYGLCDMAGNAREFTSSCFYNSCNPDDRVTRGGSYSSDWHGCVVSSRSNWPPYYFHYSYGFRVVLKDKEPEWSFVQISDTHVGSVNARKNLVAVLNKVLKEVNPAFIVNTGDVADRGCSLWSELKGECVLNYKSYSEAIKLATDKGVRVYSIPGNHDQKRGLFYEVPCSDFPFCFQDPLADSDNWFLLGRSSFSHDDNILFVALDTGSGNCSGVLTTADINFLNGLDKDVPKIILTHHPAVADDSEMSIIPDLVCDHLHIVENQDNFLDYCEDPDNNVYLVLSGHTHKNHVYDRYLGVPTGYPKYIQTGSAGKPDDSGYLYFRRINIGSVEAQSATHLTKEDYNYISAKKYSPGNLHVYDSNGQHTGYDPISGSERGIPYSVYFSHYVAETEDGNTVFPEEVLIFDPCDDYLYEVIGSDIGTYLLQIGLTEDGNETVFEADDIPTLPSSIHQYTIDWDALSQGEEGVTLRVDRDGDGVFEQIITSGTTLQAPVNLSEYADITVGRVGYDRRTGRFSVSVTVANISAEVIGEPVWLVIESISNPLVTLANADGTTIDGKEYMDLSGLLGDGQLDPGETVVKRVYFNNPSRVRFTFEPSVRGVIVP